MDGSPPTSLWLRAFLLTVLIELPVYGVMLRGRLGVPVAVAVAVLLQGLTHPALWYLFPRFSPYWAWVLVAESCVVVVEAGALAWVLTAGAREPGASRRKLVGWAGLCALVANGISTGLGFVWM